jgi:hypothetical protein
MAEGGGVASRYPPVAFGSIPAVDPLPQLVSAPESEAVSPRAVWSTSDGRVFVIWIGSNGDIAIAQPGDAVEMAVNVGHFTPVAEQLCIRSLEGDRLAFAVGGRRGMTGDCDDAEVPPRSPRLAVLLGFDASTGGLIVWERWEVDPIIGEPPMPPAWLREPMPEALDVLIGRASRALDAGDLASADSAIGSVAREPGATRALARLRARLRAARAALLAAERQRIEDGIGDAIDAGSFDDADDLLSALAALPRGEARARTLRRRLAMARAEAERERDSAASAAELAAIREALSRQMFTVGGDYSSFCSNLADLTVTDHEARVALRDDGRGWASDPEHCGAYDMLTVVVVVLESVPSIARVRVSLGIPVENRFGEETGLRVAHRGEMTRSTYERIRRNWFLGHPGVLGWTHAVAGAWSLLLE